MHLTKEQVDQINACGKYLLVGVLRRAGADCSNGGVSTKFDDFFIPHPEGPHTLEQVMRHNDGQLLELIEPAYPSCPLRVRPRNLVGHSMAGGNYVTTSDSRFSELYGAPLSIHDRVEGY